MKRNIMTIKQYDYSSEAEFLKDKIKMKEKGYSLISDDMLGGLFKSGYLPTGDYTAYYIKSDL